MTAAIVDTGPLVAFFDRAERHHRWVAGRIEELDAPLLVCEPVLAEAMHLLGRYPKAHDAMLALVQNGALSVAFRLDEHIDALRKLLNKYRDAHAGFRLSDLPKAWPKHTRAHSPGSTIGLNQRRGPARCHMPVMETPHRQRRDGCVMENQR
jgi:predicted nucleic acid-binding protein